MKVSNQVVEKESRKIPCGKREAAWDCTFYKSDRECSALLKMVCKEKACKFYKRIGMTGLKS